MRSAVKSGFIRTGSNPSESEAFRGSRVWGGIACLAVALMKDDRCLKPISSGGSVSKEFSSLTELFNEYLVELNFGSDIRVLRYVVLKLLSMRHEGVYERIDGVKNVEAGR